MEAFKGVSCTCQSLKNKPARKQKWIKALFTHYLLINDQLQFLLLCFGGCQCLNCMGWLGFFTDFESTECLLLQILLLKTLQMPKMPKGHLKGHQEDLQI